MGNANLATWAGCKIPDQDQYLAAFTAHFAAVQAWITANGGADPFGWNNVAGLQLTNGQQVTLVGPPQTAPFNDAFNDVRTHLDTPGFRLFQAAEAFQRLIRVLNLLG